MVCPRSGSLVDTKGKILVPGMYEEVANVTDEEKKLYEKIDFDMVEYAKDIGAGKLLHDTKVWRACPCSNTSEMKNSSLFSTSLESITDLNCLGEVIEC